MREANGDHFKFTRRHFRPYSPVRRQYTANRTIARRRITANRTIARRQTTANRTTARRQSTAQRTVARRQSRQSDVQVTPKYLIQMANLQNQPKLVVEKLTANNIKKISNELGKQGLIRQIDLSKLSCKLNIFLFSCTIFFLCHYI